MSVTPTDLGVYLGIELDENQTARAQMLIDDAIAQALSVVTVGEVPEDGPTEDNLPTGWEGVIRPAVARIFLNPAGAVTETTGPFGISRTANTGSLLSKAETATLRRLAGGGGAFSIDLLPTDYSPVLPPWDIDSVSTVVVP